MKVGVIGLGNMGMGAALNLLRRQHDVTGCDLREETRSAFAAEGGKVVVSPDALPVGLEAVVVFVINAAQTEQVLFGEKGCLARMEKGAVILCCATIAPEAAKALGRKIEDAGFLMVDSPVSGGASGAKAGTMTVMGSGSEAAFAKAGPVLEAISTKVWRLGDEIGVGSTVKMVNQLLAGVHIATAAAALAVNAPPWPPPTCMTAAWWPGCRWPSSSAGAAFSTCLRGAVLPRERGNGVNFLGDQQN